MRGSLSKERDRLDVARDEDDAIDRPFRGQPLEHLIEALGQRARRQRFADVGLRDQGKALVGIDQSSSHGLGAKGALKGVQSPAPEPLEFGGERRGWRDRISRPKDKILRPLSLRLSSVVARCRLGPSRTQDQPSSRFPRLTQVRSGFSLRSCSRRCRRRAPSPMGRAISQRVPRPSYSACAPSESPSARSWSRLGARRLARVQDNTGDGCAGVAAPGLKSSRKPLPGKAELLGQRTALSRGNNPRHRRAQRPHRGRLEALRRRFQGALQRLEAVRTAARPPSVVAVYPDCTRRADDRVGNRG